MVSTSHNFIYVSGGRNATGAIKGALVKIPGLKYYEPAKLNKGDWKKFNKHMPARHIKRVIPKDQWKNCYKFTFVRNTYSWVVSSFFFWVKIGMRPMPKGGIMTMDDFKFAVKYYKSPAGRRHDECSKIRSQLSFISDKNRQGLMDYIGTFESLQDDFNIICREIGINPIQLTVQNSSAASMNKPHSIGIPWREHYHRNANAQEFVYQNWKMDIDHFKFKLEK